MNHPGMPVTFGWVIFAGILVFSLWSLVAHNRAAPVARNLYLTSIPGLGWLVRLLNSSPWPLALLRLFAVAVFLLVIGAGLWGVPYPERNFATTFTWTMWWTIIIISVLFLGSAWCAVCPWDALGVWMTRLRLWRRAEPESGLGWRLPQPLRTVWPALAMFVGLTWLELGLGVTASPFATAVLALVMVVLATVFLALFERKSFCRYVCPVGRTVGFYSQLATMELRPVQESRCQQCTTLECYHGSEEIEPCPTFLTMGRFSQNTYCTSCGACVLSCPHKNVSWRLRPMAAEAASGARPHWDEAWFMIILLALTLFHGVSMLPAWEEFMRFLAPLLGDTGQPLRAFSLGMVVCMAAPVVLYMLAVELTRRISGSPWPFRRLFATLSFPTLAVAFAYHLAHNLNHLTRESAGFTKVMLNPLGRDTMPMAMMERHHRMYDLLMPETALFTLQALLLLLGFWVAAKILRQRVRDVLAPGGVLVQRWAQLPMLLLMALGTAFTTWMLMQDMVMRM